MRNELWGHFTLDAHASRTVACCPASGTLCGRDKILLFCLIFSFFYHSIPFFINKIYSNHNWGYLARIRYEFCYIMFLLLADINLFLYALLKL